MANGEAARRAKGVAVVVGVGPSLGSAVARRFAREGFALGLVARTEEAARAVEAEVVGAGGAAHSARADATEPGAVEAAFAEVTRELGPVDVLVYNAGAFQMGGILDVTAERFEQCWKANCLGGFLSAKQVVPQMITRSKGTILFTGATASVRGSARFSCLAVGKFGLRALAQSLARELGPQGIHVAHVIVDGAIDTPRLRAASPAPLRGDALSPEAVAETYWQLHAQDPTAWTHELDVRPASEKF